MQPRTRNFHRWPPTSIPGPGIISGFGSAGAERRPHSDFMSALRNQMRENAVDSDRREDKCRGKAALDIYNVDMYTV